MNKRIIFCALNCVHYFLNREEGTMDNPLVRYLLYRKLATLQYPLPPTYNHNSCPTSSIHQHRPIIQQSTLINHLYSNNLHYHSFPTISQGFMNPLTLTFAHPLPFSKYLFISAELFFLTSHLIPPISCWSSFIPKPSLIPTFPSPKPLPQILLLTLSAPHPTNALQKFLNLLKTHSIMTHTLLQIWYWVQSSSLSLVKWTAGSRRCGGVLNHKNETKRNSTKKINILHTSPEHKGIPLSLASNLSLHIKV